MSDPGCDNCGECTLDCHCNNKEERKKVYVLYNFYDNSKIIYGYFSSLKNAQDLQSSLMKDKANHDIIFKIIEREMIELK